MKKMYQKISLIRRSIYSDRFVVGLVHCGNLLIHCLRYDFCFWYGPQFNKSIIVKDLEGFILGPSPNL